MIFKVKSSLFPLLLVLLKDLKINYIFLFLTSKYRLATGNKWPTSLVLFFQLNICGNFFQALWCLSWPLFLIKIIIKKSLFRCNWPREKPERVKKRWWILCFSTYVSTAWFYIWNWVNLWIIGNSRLSCLDFVEISCIFPEECLYSLQFSQ